MARYAIILKETGAVIDIKQMEGDAVPSIKNPDLYDVEKVPAGILIGMVRKGPDKAVNGFGFPKGTNIGDRHGIGAGVAKDEKAKPRPAKSGKAVA